MLPSFSFGAEGVEYGRNSAFYALADSAGPTGGVTQLLAGSNVTLTPSNGLGVVTVSATAGAGGVSSVTTTGSGISATPNTGAVVLANTGVTSVVAGSGVSVSSATGDVTVSNSGVTSLVAGSGISLSGPSGAVTVSSTVVPTFSGYQVYTFTPGAPNVIPVTGTCGRINLGPPGTAGSALFGTDGGSGWSLLNALRITNPSFNAQTRLIITDFFYSGTPGPTLGTLNNQNWNATGNAENVGPNELNIRIYGGGAIPVAFFAGQQYYVEYAVIQLNA